MASPLHGIGIDHVELHVPERVTAAWWYRDVLGLTATPENEKWAMEHPSGPLMISADGGKTSLALFEGPSEADTSKSGFRRLAFRVSGDEFLAFLKLGRELKMEPLNVIDHESQISVYFNDPYGHALELTTYDHKHVRNSL
jgi:catechol 2,3-dioxygenase-like lactoylglutathione lyase family enzyme